MNVVIDASVLIKFYVPEVLSDKASYLLDTVKEGEFSLLAPDLIFSEAGNILWKKYRLKELTRSEVDEITDAITLLPVWAESSKSLLPLAVGIAMTYGITVYDAMYVTLARIRAPWGTGLTKLNNSCWLLSVRHSSFLKSLKLRTQILPDGGQPP